MPCWTACTFPMVHECGEMSWEGSSLLASLCRRRLDLGVSVLAKGEARRPFNLEAPILASESFPK